MAKRNQEDKQTSIDDILSQLAISEKKEEKDN